jgi:hypothetical protein
VTPASVPRDQGESGERRKTLTEAGVPPPPAHQKRPRKKAVPRRWERAEPMQLWQSDITSMVLTRHSQRVYLIVFMRSSSASQMSKPMDLSLEVAG